MSRLEPMDPFVKLFYAVAGLAIVAFIGYAIWYNVTDQFTWTLEGACEDRCMVCSGRQGVDLDCDIDPRCVDMCLSDPSLFGIDVPEKE